jgi:hypothetical protein
MVSHDDRLTGQADRLMSTLEGRIVADALLRRPV